MEEKNTNFFIFKIKNGITQKEENNHGHATFSHGHAAVAVGLYLWVPSDNIAF